MELDGVKVRYDPMSAPLDIWVPTIDFVLGGEPD